jgi:phosphatidate cytidylyltransferase
MSTGSEPDAGKGKGAGRSNLQLRVISAVVLAVAVLTLAWWGGVAFRLFAAALGAVVFYEWSTMAANRYSATGRASAWLLLLLPLAALALGLDAGTVLLTVAAAVLAAVLVAAILRERFGLALGLAYAAVPAVALAFLRGDGIAGLWALLFLFACVWATDIAAYFAGRYFGGPKLAPSISPSKTWSGAIGGAAAGVAAGGIVAVVGPSSLGVVLTAFVALAVSVVSQFGDLFESAYKRRHGAKDSSQLIPGHGGVMDRVDGLVAAAVALYLAGAILAGPDNPAAGLFAG